MIHRDHRRGYESASALGQIVGREGPLNLSVTDLDLVTRKGLRDGNQLLRLIEQKQPGHSFKGPQETTVRLLDECIHHCTLCPDAQELRLDHRSGLYLVRGLIAGATTGHRETRFEGTQRIIRLRTGQHRDITSHEEFFQFLDPEDPRRRQRMGWKRPA